MRFYARYHSLRYVGEKLVIRLLAPLDEQNRDELKRNFSDILIPGGDLLLGGPLPAEEDEAELAHLPRLVLDFNRKDFARLRNLIDSLNAL